MQVLKNQLQQTQYQQKRYLVGGVSKWEKGASGEMFLLLMEHLSKSKGIGYKCQKMQNSAFEQLILVRDQHSILFCNVFDYVQWQSHPARFRGVESPFLCS